MQESTFSTTFNPPTTVGSGWYHVPENASTTIIISIDNNAVRPSRAGSELDFCTSVLYNMLGPFKVLLCSGEDFDFLVVALNTGVQVQRLLPRISTPCRREGVSDSLHGAS